MRNQYLEQKPDVEELITSHMELVRQIAWHIRGRLHSGIEIEDLIQIGYFGLVTPRKITRCVKEQRLQAMLASVYVALLLTTCAKVRTYVGPPSKCKKRLI